MEMPYTWNGYRSCPHSFLSTARNSSVCECNWEIWKAEGEVETVMGPRIYQTLRHALKIAKSWYI